MNKIYLTEEEKKEIVDIQTQENDYMVQLGQIEYQIQSLKSQKLTISEELKGLNNVKPNLLNNYKTIMVRVLLI